MLLLGLAADRPAPLEVLVLDQQPNRGKGWALVRGVAAAQGQWVLTLDADMACSPRQLLNWQAAGWLDLAGPAGRRVLIGSREHPDSRVQDGFLRHLAGRCFNLMVHLINDVPFDDTQCGFKLYPLEAARAAFASLANGGWAHDIELIRLAQLGGWEVVELPVQWRAAQGSKINLLRDSPRMFAQLLAIRLGLYFRAWLGLGGEVTAAPPGLAYRRLTSALLLAALVLVLVVFRDYPSYGDDHLQHSYGRMIWDYYRSGFQVRDFMRHVDIFYYGGLFEVFAYLVSHLWPAQEMFIRFLLIGLTGWLAYVGCARLGGLLGGPAVAFWGCLLLVACPHFLGQMFTQSKDIPFAAGYVWSLYYFARLWERLPRVPRGLAVKLGLALGITLGVRVGGAILCVYLALILAAWLASHYQGARQLGRDLGSLGKGLILPATLVAYPIMLLGWPWAQWNPLVNPFKALLMFSHFSSNGLFRYDGAWWRCDHWPWYYALHAVGMRLPDLTLWLLLLFPLALWWRLRRAPGKDGAAALAPSLGVLLLGGFFPLLYAGLSKATLYYGIRQLLFVLPPLCVLAGATAAWLPKALPGTALRKAATLLLALAALATLGVMAVLHPWEAAYFNQTLAGGIKQGAQGNDYQYAGMGKSEAYALITKYLDSPANHLPAQDKYRVFIGIHHLAFEQWDRQIMPPNLEPTKDRGQADFILGDMGPGALRLLAPFKVAAVERLGLEILPIFDARPLRAAWGQLLGEARQAGLRNLYTLDSFLVSQPFDDLSQPIAFHNPADRGSNAFVRDRGWTGRLLALGPGLRLENPLRQESHGEGAHLDSPGGQAWLEFGQEPFLRDVFQAMGLEFQQVDSPPFHLYYQFRAQPRARQLDPGGWRAVAGDNLAQAGAAFDRDQNSQWQGPGRQAPGQSLVLDLGRLEQGLCGLRLWAGDYNDLPAVLGLETSSDGQAWQAASTLDTRQGVFVWNGLYPEVHASAGPLDLGFAPRAARYLRLTQLGQRPRPNPWCIVEMSLYAAGPGAAAKDPARAVAQALAGPGNGAIYTPCLLEGYLRGLSQAQAGRFRPCQGPLAEPAGAAVVVGDEDRQACQLFLDQAGWPCQVEEAGGYSLFRLGPAALSPGLEPLEPGAWRAQSDLNPQALGRLADGDPSTRWDSGQPQKAGMRLFISLDHPRRLAGLRLETGASAQDYPRGLSLEAQGPDGAWRPVDYTWRPRPPFYFNGDMLLAQGAAGRGLLTFAPLTAAKLRLTLTADEPGHHWSIHELTVLRPAAGQ